MVRLLAAPKSSNESATFQVPGIRWCRVIERAHELANIKSQEKARIGTELT